MKYKALTGFSGKVSASKGSEIELTDKAIIADLLRAGYIEAIGQDEAKKNGKSKAKDKVDDAAEAETPAEQPPAEDEAKK